LIFRHNVAVRLSFSRPSRYDMCAYTSMCTYVCDSYSVLSGTTDRVDFSPKCCSLWFRFSEPRRYEMYAYTLTDYILHMHTHTHTHTHNSVYLSRGKTPAAVYSTTTDYTLYIFTYTYTHTHNSAYPSRGKTPAAVYSTTTETSKYQEARA
jgi:hypothetical protein